MARRFIVHFKDGNKIECFDVLSLEVRQIAEIRKIAEAYDKLQLQNYETSGHDLSYLTNTQKQRILTTKNRILFGRSPKELIQQKRVVVSLHFQERMLERTGSNQTSKLLETAQFIIDSDIVLKAQFKGYSSLSYTIAKQADRSLKLPISFKQFKKSRQIVSITLIVRGAAPSQLMQKIGQDEEMQDDLMAFRRKLIEQANKHRPETKE